MCVDSNYTLRLDFYFILRQDTFDGAAVPVTDSEKDF
jgi:hypothetical protein